MSATPAPIIYPPADLGTVIWRYLDLTKLVAMLENGSLHFARSDELGDPFEGSVTVDLATRRGAPDSTWLGKVFGPYAGQWYEGIRKYVFINCWSMSPVESAALWSLYVPSGYGVAVRSTYSRLRDVLPNTTRHVDIGVVRYIDFATDSFFPPDGPENENLYTPFFHKRSSFEHEHELRAIWWDGESSNSNMSSHEPGGPMPTKFMEGVFPGGVDETVDLPALIDQLRVSPTAPPWFRALVEKVVRRYGLGFPVVQSDLASDPIF